MSQRQRGHYMTENYEKKMSLLILTFVTWSRRLRVLVSTVAGTILYQTYLLTLCNAFATYNLLPAFIDLISSAFDRNSVHPPQKGKHSDNYPSSVTVQPTIPLQPFASFWTRQSNSPFFAMC